MARKENMTKQKGSEKEILLQSENNVIVGRLPRRWAKTFLWQNFHTVVCKILLNVTVVFSLEGKLESSFQYAKCQTNLLSFSYVREKIVS